MKPRPIHYDKTQCATLAIYTHVKKTDMMMQATTQLIKAPFLRTQSREHTSFSTHNFSTAPNVLTFWQLAVRHVRFNAQCIIQA